jgi:protein-S-isoprenylcysteine O-methyltransferase Ste14
MSTVHEVSSVWDVAGHPYWIGAIAVLVLYVIQSEVRFGARARKSEGEATDRGSSIALSIAALVPVMGFVFSTYPDVVKRGLPTWFFEPALSWMPASAWAGVAIGALGLALRLWAVLTLRHRYTRTLLIQENRSVERGGPYRFVRHPGYLGSLMTLNGIAAAGGSAPILIASLIATIAGYAYRVHVEDKMLVTAMGEPYESYRREVGGLLPFLR